MSTATEDRPKDAAKAEETPAKAAPEAEFKAEAKAEGQAKTEAKAEAKSDASAEAANMPDRKSETAAPESEVASDASEALSRGTVSIRNVHREATFVDDLTVPAILGGLSATIRHFFTNLFGREKYSQTIQYPDVKVTYPERFRGMHRLVPRDDGSTRCVACYMCQTACPARCIHIVAGESGDSSIEKYPVVFEIDELRCVVCGLCVESCPCDAIRMDTGIHPLPVFEREDALFGKVNLVAMLGRNEAQGQARKPGLPPATAAGTGRVDRSHGDGGAGGSAGGYEHQH